MASAPVADQLKLLDVQALDTHLAKLTHARRSHPTIATLEEFSARASDLDRAGVDARTAVSDARRAVTKAETDVEQVRGRAQRDQQRLDSGAGSAKDMQALAHELESLAKRQSDLEEVELEAMEVMEQAESALAAITTQQEALTQQVDEVQAEQEVAFAELDQQLETARGQRAVAADGIDAALLALYDRVRERTGGLGALRLRGSSTQPLQIQLSLTEKAAIEAAPADEVIRSEDGYILVRVTD